MSGLQSVSAFEPSRVARIAPMDSTRNAESEKQAVPAPAPQHPVKEAAATAKEDKQYFNNLSEDDKKKLENQLNKLNDSLHSYGKMLRFKYNEEAKQTYVEVVDSESQKVVASLPPEFLVDLSVKMKEMIGVFLDKKL